jgi:hypothetical protein
MPPRVSRPPVNKALAWVPPAAKYEDYHADAGPG